MTRPSAVRSRRLYDGNAARYDRGMAAVERRIFGEHRDWATSRARGVVVELAVGTGLNLPRYPPAVTRVVGVDQSEGMLRLAGQRVLEAGLGDRVELRRGDAGRLDLADGAADTVVATYALCSMPDPVAVLREALRVLRPGGRLLLVEHGVAARAPVRALQRVVQPLSIRLAADDLLGDPSAQVLVAGFELVEADRAGRWGVVHRVAARRPSTR